MKRQPKKIAVDNHEKLKHLTATDLFEDSLIQVFKAKTGEWIGTVQKGTENTLDVEEQPEINAEQPVCNPNQTKLF